MVLSLIEIFDKNFQEGSDQGPFYSKVRVSNKFWGLPQSNQGKMTHDM